MDRDRFCASLLQLLHLRWLVSGRTQQPEAATFHEIAACLQIDREVLRECIADLVAAGLAERIEIEHSPTGNNGYRISPAGRQLVLTDQATQRHRRLDG